MIRNFRRHTRAWLVLNICLVAWSCGAHCLLVFSGGQIRAGVSATPKHIKYVARFGGVSISARPGRRSLVIRAIAKNRGNRAATLVEASNSFGWWLSMFDRNGRRLPYTATRLKTQYLPGGRLIYLAPGKTAVGVLKLSRYFRLRHSGVFYLFASRLVAAGGYKGGSTNGLVQKYVRSPILKLTLHRGFPPVWKVVPALPRLKPIPPLAPGIAPRFPKYNIPTSGPIATPAPIAQAVRAGELGHL